MSTRARHRRAVSPALLALAITGLAVAAPDRAAAGEVQGITLVAQRDAAIGTAWLRGRVQGRWSTFGGPELGDVLPIATAIGADVGGWPQELTAVVDHVDADRDTFQATIGPTRMTIGIMTDLTPAYRVCCRPGELADDNHELELIVTSRVVGFGGDSSAPSYQGPLELTFVRGRAASTRLSMLPAPGGLADYDFSFTPLAYSGLVTAAPAGLVMFPNGALSWTPATSGLYATSIRAKIRGTAVTYGTIDLLLRVVEPVTWQAGPWSACDAQCGADGTRQRVVVCMEEDGTVVADGECVAQVGPKPATTEACSGPVCPTYGWSAGGWSACSVACGDGVQVRTVVCRDEATGAVVDDALCTGPMPAESQACSQPDDFAPVLVCPAAVTLECTDGGASHAFAGTATDGCDGAPLEVTCDGPAFPLGFTPVGCQAVDPQGNQATCATSVAVLDTLPPSIECPPPAVVECTSPAGALVTPAAATATDACGPAAVSSPAAGVFALGTTVVTHGAADGMGYQAACTTTVTVVDTTPPVFEPASLARQTVGGACGGPTTGFVPPTATDGCSPVAVTCDTSGLGAGSNLVTCTAVDASGNLTTAHVDVDVIAGLRIAFQAPLDDDNQADDVATDADVVNRFKAGQTVRHKVKLFACDGTDVTETAPVTVRLRVAPGAGGEGAALVNDVEDYLGVGDAGGLMALGNRAYEYQLATTAAAFPRGQQFQSLVTVTYDVAPHVVVAAEDVRLFSR